MIARHCVDRPVVWRPVIAWAEKFKVEQVESSDALRSWVLDMIRHSRSLALLRKKTVRPLSERIMLHFSRTRSNDEPQPQSPGKTWLMRVLAVVVLLGIGYGVRPRCDDLDRPAEGGSAGGRHRPRRDFLARESDLAARGSVDDSGGRCHRFQSAPGTDCAATRADRGFGSRDCIVSRCFAFAYSYWWRPRHRLNHASAAGHTVVHPVQRDRRGNVRFRRI